MPSTSHEVSVGSYAWLKIIIDETGTNAGNNTSSVRVRGVMRCDYHSWHTDATVSRSISGSASYSPGPFGFDIPDGGSYTYIDHTFTIGHNSDGTKTVSFTVHYGDTQLGNFGANKSCSDSLTLTTLGSDPGKPGVPTFANITPTTLTVNWTAPSDDGGSSIKNYQLRRWDGHYTGSHDTGTFTDSKGNSRSRDLTGLTPGAEYTFAVQCQNNTGWGDFSNFAYVTLSAGAMIRVGGVWKMAIPYIRVGGVWKQAVPYVRHGGTWHQAE